MNQEKLTIEVWITLGILNTNYLLTESEAFKGKSQTEALSHLTEQQRGHYSKAEVKIERSS